MAKGDMMKKEIAAALKNAFGDRWIGEVNKKYYISGRENGETIQIAVALTCPKNMIEVDNAVSAPVGDWDWSGNATAQPVAVHNAPAAEITEEEQNNIAELLAKLGL